MTERGKESFFSSQKPSITLYSPAKLNLFFRVLRKREDGFHEIASLFQTIDLFDELQIRKAEQDHIYCNDPRIPVDSSNLIVKAAALFRKKTGLPAYAEYVLQKNIPIEAGLGGGSGNLATTLWGLRSLYAPEISGEQLMSWASEISSDAPFFFSTGRAYCTGRGEVIENIPEIPEQKLWIAKPLEGLSTPLVYKNCKPHLFSQRDPREILENFSLESPQYFNDLEMSAFELLPTLSFLKKQLLDLGFTEVVMTGSGTAFFCMGDIRKEPFIEGVQFFPVQFVFRTSHEWYERYSLISK